MQNLWLIFVLYFTVACLRSFVDTAPVAQGANTEGVVSKERQDSSVQELESLKKSLGKTLDLMKSQTSTYTVANGEKDVHSEIKEEVRENDNILAKLDQHVDTKFKGSSGKPSTSIQTDIDIPSQGIHKSVVQLAPDFQISTKNGNRRSSLNLESLPASENSVDNADASPSSVQYSPLDMAEYVFWTGDEKGVTLAVEEFLQEELMTKEEAISFLQEIKYNLEYLKSHYSKLGLNFDQQQQTQRSKVFKQTKMDKNEILLEKPELIRSNFNINLLRKEASKKRMAEETHALPDLNKGLASQTTEKTAQQDDDYLELLERLRVADFLYTEYSLEEVIYQLAKVMFTQSFTRTSAEAQQALQKFTNFLEQEADQGRISRALEKKVLDVLIASLSDTLTEHPELLSTPRGSSGAVASKADGQHFIRQILELSSKDKMAVRELFAYKGHPANDEKKQLKENNGISHAPHHDFVQFKSP